MAGLEFALGERFAGLEPTEARSEAFTAYFGALLKDGRTVSRPMRAMEDVANPYPCWLSRPPADYGPFGSTMLGDSFVVSAVEALVKDPIMPASSITSTSRAVSVSRPCGRLTRSVGSTARRR